MHLRASEPGSASSFVARAALFAVAASLAFYIPFKYAAQLHAIHGLYAVLFPLSGFLALAGLTLAVKPGKACDCSAATRAGAGIVAGLWMATGLMCVPSLAATIAASPLGGSFAAFHMTMQHVLLSGVVLAFAVAPRRTAQVFGASVPAADSPRVVPFHVEPAL